MLQNLFFSLHFFLLPLPLKFSLKVESKRNVKIDLITGNAPSLLDSSLLFCMNDSRSRWTERSFRYVDVTPFR